MIATPRLAIEEPERKVSREKTLRYDENEELTPSFGEQYHDRPIPHLHKLHPESSLGIS